MENIFIFGMTVDEVNKREYDLDKVMRIVLMMRLVLC